MMIKKEISELIVEALRKIGTETSREILVEESADPKFGDYNSNIAMTFKGTENREQRTATPKEFAEKIIKNLPENEIIEKAEVAGPGFINFWVSKKYLQNELQNITEAGESYGENDSGKGEKVLVEFISANPTGPMHIGNARGGPLGDIIAEVLKKTGHKVEREFYVNDIGRQARLFGESVLARIKGEELPKDGYPGEYVKDLAKKISKKIDKKNEDVNKLTIVSLSTLAIGEMVKGMKETATKMGIEYDNFKYESEYLNAGKTEAIIKELTEKGNTKINEGALWFMGKPSRALASEGKSKFLEDRECVLERSKGGGYTYFANDIAYHQDKFERGFDRLIDVWGANHFGHIPRMKEAMAALDHDPKKLEIVLYQYVQLKEEGIVKKMAKREGTYVTADEVLGLVSKDVFRMMMIMTAPNSHLEFDLKLAQEQSKKNLVFYVQYAYARICSILAKAVNSEQGTENRYDGLTHETEIALQKELIKFPDLVSDVAQNYEVQRLPFYAIELSKKFHRFYKSCRVLQAETEELKNARLALTGAARIVLKNTLDLMGIEAPERM